MLKKGYAFLLALVFLCPSAEAQNSKSDVELSQEQLKSHLSVIASDAMQGRETGTEGIKKAAKYIENTLKNSQLQALPGQESYFVDVELFKASLDTTALNINGELQTHLKTFASPPFPNRSINRRFDKVFFTGYGIQDENYNDYRWGNFKNKAVLFIDGEPVDEKGNAILGSDGSPSKWAQNVEEKLQIAGREGAALVLIVSPDFNMRSQRVRRAILSRRLFTDTDGSEKSGVPPHMYISSEFAKELIGEKYEKVLKRREKALRTQRPWRVKIPVSLDAMIKAEKEEVEAFNIAAYLPGKQGFDSPYGIISAHFDHLGMRNGGIYNGADDNGTGTSALLSMAETLAANNYRGDSLQQSLVFMWLCGEEKGLLGSKYYSDNPILPLSKASFDVNVDMIGRRDVEHPAPEEYIYVIGADRISSELHEAVVQTQEALSPERSIDLDFTFNEPDDPNRFYYRSDHYNFAKKGIPSVFFFSGVHEDYHMQSDEVDGIDFELYHKRTLFILDVLRNISLRKDLLPRDVAN